MKFTLNWLQNYVDTADLSPDQLAEKLTMLGLEVDSVTPLYQELSALKTGLVLSCEKHPNADKLSLCQVSIGEETLQIVCGAPNVRKGLAVVIATTGTTLPGNFKIKKSKVRGLESFGMICSESELGLSEEHDGIMELPEGTGVGQSFITALGLDDTFIEVDLTPNRPDCASVIGIAREIAGITGKELAVPVTGAAIENSNNEFSVTVESDELCPRYTARLIKNIKIAPSPWWLRKRLISVGLRPINNIVDITNFVMMEYGQPLHAFDFDTLADRKIVVRTPRENETTFTTLDNSDRPIDRETLLICDGEKPVAVAGVMGGMNSEVTDSTTNILLESACFNAVSIRKTARKLNLATDASYRFERGVDPDGTINALNRAVDLICEIAGGKTTEDGIDVYGGQKQTDPLTLRISRTNAHLGIDLDGSAMIEMLESISIKCEEKDQDTLLVTPPSFRVDIEREADLVEEIARLYGYDNIPVTLPHVSLSYPEQDKNRLKRKKITLDLTSIGYSEAINYSFGSTDHADMFFLSDADPRRQAVALLNPLSEEQSIMRTMLLPSLLENIKRNISFQKSAVKLFEIGKVFTSTGKNTQPVEKFRLSAVLSGNRYGESSPLHYQQEQVDILDAKGGVEFILKNMSLTGNDQKTGIRFRRSEEGKHEPFSEIEYSLDVCRNELIVGTIGKIKNGVLKNFNIKHDVYYFDLDYDVLCEVKQVPRKFTSLPVYPSVKRDVALIVPETVSSGELLEQVRSVKDKLVESAEIFDIFQGEKIPSGHKSVALSITYRSPTKTLTEKNVEKSHSKIVRLLTDKFQGSFRNE
ncbi:MAG: phenylalanine--tRNA ligase subunit beta [Deltaproteobacteria bacterium]|nr:phenylalanine--tRNA ligase subunit beta [Deltaproteobacteria bacterium]